MANDDSDGPPQFEMNYSHHSSSDSNLSTSNSTSQSVTRPPSTLVWKGETKRKSVDTASVISKTDSGKYPVLKQR